jgi:hypothetical protein
MSEGPSPLKEEDDWVRGNRLQLARQISTADVNDDSVWQRLYLGDAAIKLMRGVASNEDVGKVMGYVIASCESDVQRGAKRLLEINDIACKEAQDIHFNTRVSAAILNRINQLMRDGLQAAADIEQRNEDMP